MPAALDACVQSLLGKWKSDPKSRPAPRKEKGGKPQEARSQAFAICTKSLKKAGKLEHDDETYYLQEEVEFSNPAMLGYAATNRPHLHDLDPTSIVDEEGQPWKEGPKFLKLPLVILGKWKHPRGILNFTKKFVDRVVDNFNKKVTGYPPSGDCRHHPEWGALSWAKKFLTETREDGRDQISVIAEPTEKGLEVVEKKQFLYNSIEFHPNYSPRRALEERWAAEEIEGIYAEACPCEYIDSPELFSEEAHMPEELEVTLEQFGELQKELDALKAANEAIKADSEAIKADSDAIKAELQAEREKRLLSEKFAAQQFIEGLIAKTEARRDGEGRAHPKMFLEWMERILKLEDHEEIKLENADNLSDVHAYYRKQIYWLAQNMDGTVPMKEVDTQPDTSKIGTGDEPDKLDEEQLKELEEAWSFADIGG